MKFKFILLCLTITSSFVNSQHEVSVFDSLDPNSGSGPSGASEPDLSPQSSGLSHNMNAMRFSEVGTGSSDPNGGSTNDMKSRSANMGLQAMLDKIKSKVTNPRLKSNFTLTNIANFFASFISGNEFLNNLEVLGSTKLNRTIISELNVQNSASIEDVLANNFHSQSLNVTRNEISLNPYAQLKLKSSNIVFHAKDIFEVIAFMKYIVKICGNKLEKCDFRNILMSNNNTIAANILTTNHKSQQPNTFTNFNSTLIEAKLTNSFEKKLTIKLKELEERMLKQRQEIEAKLRKEFDEKNKEKDLEIKKLKEELSLKIDKSIQEELKKASELDAQIKKNNLRKSIDMMNKFKQKNDEIKQVPNTLDHKHRDKIKNPEEDYQFIQKESPNDNPSYEELEKEFNSLVSVPKRQDQELGFIDMNSPVNKFVNDYYYSSMQPSEQENIEGEIL